ncbi:hypothetical protein DL93DRAFT_294249 [Clavulina sp. PMI_390]|nr:hypothetical protein DL93DRAFT_294249 [Clavulina sp. PMI_390]
MSFGHLPQELVLEVFEWVIEPTPDFERTSFDTLAALSTVNHSWQQTIASSARLWSTIAVAFPDQVDFIRRYHGLEICLVRSLGYPLRLYFSFGRNYLDMASPAVGILHAAGAFTRCYSLTVKAVYERDLMPFLPIPPDLPQLRSLSISLEPNYSLSRRALIEPPALPPFDQKPPPMLNLSEIILERGCGSAFDPSREKYLAVDALRLLTITIKEERLQIMLPFLKIPLSFRLLRHLSCQKHISFSSDSCGSSLLPGSKHSATFALRTIHG